jgi:putative membrane protein
MAYNDLDKEQPILRDILSVERTHIANGRTLLAYLITAYMILLAALALLKLFEGDAIIKVVSFILVLSALVTGAFGVYRFQHIKKNLFILENPPQ